MKLLIVTQKVDKNEPILGFFHHWIEEFAKLNEFVTVICLEMGEHNLPANVKVLSLGKEKGPSVVRYIVQFYKYIWQERKNYDSVFIHMNQEYILMGWKFWKLWGKKIFLWRNHAKGDLWTRMAVLISDKVFCTSPQSFTARFKKTKIMPVGVLVPDKLAQPVQTPSILSLGRISPIKRLHVFVEALLILDKNRVDFSADILGEPSNGQDYTYVESLKKLGEPLISTGKLKFAPGVSLDKAMNEFSSHRLFINLTESGSLDKSIFGAMASGSVVLVANRYFKDVLPDDFIVESSSAQVLASHMESILNTSQSVLVKIRENNFTYVKKNHSLEKLMQRLMVEML